MPKPKRIRIIGVYIITNSVTGRVYIGASTDVAKRWTKHLRRSSNHKLRADISTFGAASFTIQVLECLESELGEREHALILRTASDFGRDKLYNKSFKGTPCQSWSAIPQPLEPSYLDYLIGRA